jgi:hypothetical protein
VVLTHQLFGLERAQQRVRGRLRDAEPGRHLRHPEAAVRAGQAAQDLDRPGHRLNCRHPLVRSR